MEKSGSYFDMHYAIGKTIDKRTGGEQAVICTYDVYSMKIDYQWFTKELLDALKMVDLKEKKN